MLPNSPLYPAPHIVDKPSPLEQRADQIFVDNLVAGNTRPKLLCRLWVDSQSSLATRTFQIDIRPDFWIIRATVQGGSQQDVTVVQQGGDQTQFHVEGATENGQVRRVYPGTADTLKLTPTNGLSALYLEVAAIIGYNTQDVL